MPDPFAAISGLDKSNDDKLKPEWYSKPLSNIYDAYAGFYNKRDLRSASNAYNQALEQYYPQAQAGQNAAYYNDLTRQIIADPNTYLSDYEKIRSGNLSSLGDVFKNVLDYGLAGEKARLAAGGYGNTGPSSYDRILTSTRTASNLTPVLNQIYGNLGREASASYGSREDRNRYLINLMGNDILGQYQNTAAQRALLPYLTRMGLVSGNVGALGTLGGNIRNNLAGYQLEPGLTSRINDIGNDIWGTLTGGLYGQAYGSQPGQDTATGMGILGTVASIYGGSNQYQAPQLAQNPPSSGGGWMSAYGGQPNYVQQNPMGAYGNMGVSYSGQPLQPNSAQEEYYRQLLGSGNYGGGLGVGY